MQTNFLPSKNSSDAPPPVEIWVILFCNPNFSTALALSPPPITLRAPLSVASATAKALVNRGMQTDLETGLALESWAVFNHNQTTDAAEGIAAFKEKRTPIFEGR